jgi:calcineurin-like phosphoesterase family protein
MVRSLMKLPRGHAPRTSMPMWPALLGALLLVTLGSFASVPSPAAGGGQTPTAVTSLLTFPAEADAYVTSRTSGRNFGSISALRIDGSPDIRSFLRFDLGGLGVPISRATLRLFAASTTSGGINVHGVSTNSWGEATLTYRNKPRVLSATGSAGPIRGGTWVEWDVTSLLRSTGQVSFALTTTNSTAIRLMSRESSAPPQLVISSSSDVSPSAPPASVDPTTPPASAGGSLAPAPPPSASRPASPSPFPPRSRSPSPAPSAGDFIVMGAGDIACEPPSLPFGSSCHEYATSELLASADLVLTFGDNQYQDGTLDKFLGSYHRSWGRFKAKTRPAVGNHDYLTAGASGYFGYFGALAGERGKGYYSFDAGGWHFVALNSQCSAVGGCGPGSPQYEWLRADLAASTAACTAAYWHHPRFSAGKYSNDPDYQPFWELLYADGAEVALAGHDHSYQRYAPMTPDGLRDDARGIREFVVGTGGKNHYAVSSSTVPNREVAEGSTFGVLKLTLRADGYDWAFVPEAGETFTDAGSGVCH